MPDESSRNPFDIVPANPRDWKTFEKKVFTRHELVLVNKNRLRNELGIARQKRISCTSDATDDRSLGKLLRSGLKGLAPMLPAARAIDRQLKKLVSGFSERP